MNSYLFIVLGWLLGQLIFITVQCIIIHRNDSYKHTFREAFALYVKRDTGPMILAALVMLVFVFVLPELTANLVTAQEGSTTTEQTKYNRVLSSILKWLRVSSVVLGVASQGIGFLAVSRITKWIKKKDEEVDKK